MTSQSRLRRIRILLVVVVVGLVVSGLTAFPLELETRYLLKSLQPLAPRVPALVDWIRRVHDGLAETGRRYPFMACRTLIVAGSAGVASRWHRLARVRAPGHRGRVLGSAA